MRKPDWLQIKIEGKRTCSLCGAKPILRQVGSKGFCKKHVPQAFVAAQQQGNNGGVRSLNA